jgi:phage minor structural protein
MEVIFLSNGTLFTRSDMESGHWVQEEMSVNATFPYDPDKVIERGQRIAFRDPSTDELQVFEIRSVSTYADGSYQQLTAEHIAISELQDEHINTTQITNKTAAQALTTALNGTLWSVGTNTSSGTSSADFSRGSVWQAVTTIQQNWNVYITPRVVISANGTITGRFLDISPAGGTWRGVRLSIRKNFLDPVVTYNDEEVLTALYGYGGSIDVAHSGSEDTREELTFANVVWSATSEHPAKPSGQTYLEWPEKTALYGRNGRPRFGYYQNANIKDANVLLQKTWETLKRTCDPKISISGLCAELYRLGYSDEPIRLHDLAIVEIEETGETFYKEIIKLDVDLVDPSGTRLDIGDYIPNIIYINRETAEKSRGGGGGGGRGQTNLEAEQSETYTEFIRTDDMIGMVVGTRNGGYYVKAGEIALAINATGEPGSYESTAYITADHVNISATSTVHTLAGEMHVDADGKLIIDSAGGMYVERTESGTTAQFGVFDSGNLTGGIIVNKVNGTTNTYITGDHINISGTSTAQTLAGAMELDSSGHLVIKEGAGLYVEHTSGGSLATFGVYDNSNLTGGIIVGKVNGQTGTYVKIQANKINLDGYVTTSMLESAFTDAQQINVDQLTINNYLTCLGYNTTWQSQSVVTDVSVSKTTTHRWVYLDSVGSQQTNNTTMVTNVTKSSKTINYLGR